MSIREFFTIKEFTGKHMLAVMVLFFGTIISVNLVLTYFAVNTWTGLVAKNGYVESIRFKDQQAEITAQSKLGWKSRLRVEKGHLLYSLKDETGKPIPGLKIVALLGRPTTEQHDKIVSFRQVRPGEYLVEAPADKGQWQIDITAHDSQGRKYRKIFRFVNNVT